MKVCSRPYICLTSTFDSKTKREAEIRRYLFTQTFALLKKYFELFWPHKYDPRVTIFMRDREGAGDQGATSHQRLRVRPRVTKESGTRGGSGRTSYPLE